MEGNEVVVWNTHGRGRVMARSYFDRRFRGTPRRQSMGAAFLGMTCLGCGHPTMIGMFDLGGHPYVTCTTCRFKVINQSIEVVAGIRMLSRLLGDKWVRDRWESARADVLGEVTRPIETEAAAKPVAEEVHRG